MPELVGRPGWNVAGAAEDLELLAWVGRFRFVTAELAAVRLGLTVQRARARLRRLRSRGLVGSSQANVSAPRAWYLTTDGSVLVGGGRRKAPRADVQREHELAIIDLVARLDAQHPGGRVLTERECRTVEVDRDGGRRFSVALPSSRFGTRHWPDAVLLDGDQSVALEIELTAKTPDRLRAILAGYRDSGYTTVRYLTGSPSVAARVTRLADAEGRDSQSDTGRPDRRQRLMTASEVARLLGVPRSSVYEYARRRPRGLPSITIGRHRRFVRADVEEWIDELRASGRR